MLNNKHSQLLAYHCKALLKNDFPLSNFRCLSRNLFNAQRCFNIIPDSKTVQKEIIQGLYADYRSKLSSYGTAQYSILSWLLIATVTMSLTALFLVAGCLFAWRKFQCVTGILLSLSKFLLTDWWKWVVSWFDSTSYIMITTLYTTYAEEPRVRVSKKIIDDITESSCI